MKKLFGLLKCMIKKCLDFLYMFLTINCIYIVKKNSASVFSKLISLFIIKNRRNEKTILIIAHRLSTLKNCDEIYRVQDGQIIKER